VEERFLFDGIGVDAAGEGVNQGDILTAAILTNTAGPPFGIGNRAGLGTELTLDPPLLELAIPRGLTSREIFAFDDLARLGLFAGRN
jgi:hypothetical protein